MFSVAERKSLGPHHASGTAIRSRLAKKIFILLFYTNLIHHLTPLGINSLERSVPLTECFGQYVGFLVVQAYRGSTFKADLHSICDVSSGAKFYYRCDFKLVTGANFV